MTAVKMKSLLPISFVVKLNDSSYLKIIKVHKNPCRKISLISLVYPIDARYGTASFLSTQPIFVEIIKLTRRGKNLMRSFNDKRNGQTRFQSLTQSHIYLHDLRIFTSFPCTFFFCFLFFYSRFCDGEMPIKCDNIYCFFDSPYEVFCSVIGDQGGCKLND